MKKCIFFILISFCFFSCGHESAKPKVEEGAVNIHFVQDVDGQALVYNQFLYHNQAGNTYKIANIEYYISKIIFYKEDGTAVDNNVYQYVNPSIEQVYTLKIEHIPNANYKAVSFVFGIDSSRNHKFGLPQTDQNISMEWPDQLGGGYHFMRFEGQFLYQPDSTKAYVIHLGKNGHQVFFKNDSLSFQMENNTVDLDLRMNINNWFKSPNRIDLNDNYTSIMDDEAAQQKFMNNAIHVFEITKSQ